jgi:hypothetical protein
MMAIQDFGGLLFGGGGTGLEDYLSADQQSGIRNQAMLQAAAALLQAGGPSRQPVSLGQALGGALQAGSAGYSQAQQGAVQSLLVRQKLAEAKRQEDFRRALQTQQMQPQMAGGGEVTTITPDQAISMEGLPAGPTVARANLIGQQVRAPAPQMSQQEMLYQDAMNKYVIADRSGYPDIAAKYLETALKIKPREEVTGDIFKSASGEYVQRTKSGQFIPVSAQFAPIEKPMGAPIKVTDFEGKQVLVNQMSDGTFKTVEGYGPARELIQVDRGGVITFMDKDKVPAGTSFGKTLAPQIIGGAEAGGYFQVGGGGGGVGGAPRPAGAPAPAGAPSAVAPTVGTGAPQPAPSGLQPIIPLQPKAPEAFMKASRQLNDLRGAIEDYKIELKSGVWVVPKNIPIPFTDSGMPLPSGEDTARVAGKYNSLLMGVKNLYELGALTGPDMSIIERQLTNPSSWTGLLTSKNAMNAQVKVLEDMLDRADKNLSSSYKQPMPTAATTQKVFTYNPATGQLEQK